MAMKITNFGGIYPKASPRALPNDGAQTAHNLQANTPEFRPAGADTTVVAVSGVTNPLTIYRLQRSSDGSLNTNYSNAANWKVYSADVNLVKGPNNDDSTDRHYLSYNDGSTAPRLIDATGENRQLGVPRPSAAPTVTVNVVDEFTTEERGIELAALRDTCVQIIRENATATWVGAARPGTTTAGYADHTTGAGFPSDDPSQQVRVYRLTGAGGTINDAYSAVSDENFSWVFDPALGPIVGQSASGYSWTSSGLYHVAIQYAAYGLTYTIDDATIRTQLAALILPGTVDTPAFTSDQLDLLLVRLNDYLDPDGGFVKPKIDALAAAVGKLKVLLDGGLRVSMAATTQAFYSKTDVAATISDAKANFVNSVWNAALLVVHSSTPIENTGGTAGDGSSAGE